MTQTSEMLAVYSDSPPLLDDVYRQLLNFIEVYEQNGLGWVFSYFTSLKLTLWHLDPLRASVFVSLPRWIHDKREGIIMLLELGTIASNWLYWQDCRQLTSAVITRIV